MQVMDLIQVGANMTVIASAKEGDSDWGKEVMKGQIIARGVGASGEQAVGQRRL
jgi:hypothetical protein